MTSNMLDMMRGALYGDAALKFRPPVFEDTGENTVTNLIVEKAIYVIIPLVLFLLAMYGFLYLSKFIKQWKMLDNRYIDNVFKDRVEWSIKGGLSMLVFFITILCISNVWPWFEVNVWNILWGGDTNYILSMGLIALLVIVIGLMTSIIHRFFEYYSGGLEEKPEKPLNPRVGLIIELSLKYFLLVLGAIISVLIALAAIGLRETIVGGLSKFLRDNASDLIFIIVVITLGIVIVKIVETFFEDLKRRESPYSSQLIDIIKLLVRYAVYLILGISVGFTLLGMFQLGQTAQIIVVVIMVIIVLTVAIAATSSIRNGFSGLVLMAFRPFEEGDKVRLGDGLVCEIAELGVIFTKVRNARGEVFNIPNNTILENPILNYSKSKDYAISVIVHTPHALVKEDAERLLEDAAKRTEGIIKKKRPEIYILHIEEMHAVYEMHAFTNDHHRLKRVRSDLVHNIKDLFKRHSIRALVRTVEHEEVRKAWEFKSPFNAHSNDDGSRDGETGL